MNHRHALGPADMVVGVIGPVGIPVPCQAAHVRRQFKAEPNLARGERLLAVVFEVVSHLDIAGVVHSYLEPAGEVIVAAIPVEHGLALLNLVVGAGKRPCARVRIRLGVAGKAHDMQDRAGQDDRLASRQAPQHLAVSLVIRKLGIPAQEADCFRALEVSSCGHLDDAGGFAGVGQSRDRVGAEGEFVAVSHSARLVVELKHQRVAGPGRAFSLNGQGAFGLGSNAGADLALFRSQPPFADVVIEVVPEVQVLDGNLYRPARWRNGEQLRLNAYRGVRFLGEPPLRPGPPPAVHRPPDIIADNSALGQFVDPVHEMNRLIEVAPVANALIGKQEIVIHPGELHGADEVVAAARRVQKLLHVGAPVIPEPGVKFNAISQGTPAVEDAE